MKLGAEPKKVAILGGLVVVGAYLFYANVLSSPDAPPRASTAAPAPARVAAPPPAGVEGQPPARRGSSRTADRSQDFRPSLKRNPEDKLDPMSIDPTLRLDLLAKVHAVERQGGERNLFQFSAAPPPPAPKDVPRIVPKTPAQTAAEKAKEKPGPEAAKPAPPPINLKYYGYSTQGGSRKNAFFLDGEDILVAGEGDLVKHRYKVVKIGVTSVVMQDTASKHEQTLPLVEELAG